MKQPVEKTAGRAARACAWGVVLALTAHPAFAQSSARSAAQGMAEMHDLNNDERISYDEFVHSIAVKAMAEMDADKSGALSKSEAGLPSAPRDPGAHAVDFNEADANKDGAIGLEELKRPLHANPAVNRAFQRLDKDGDGYLSRAELGGPDAEGVRHIVPQVIFKF